MHAVGVLHRDVKPSNVLMEGRAPILIDFGLARVADDPRLTHTGWLLGTPGYLAPEILYGEDATTASDVHSWAATVAFAGTGRPPFGRGPSMAIMDRVRRGEHDLTGLPDDLRPLVAAALDPDPSRRPTLAEISRPARRPDRPVPRRSRPARGRGPLHAAPGDRGPRPGRRGHDPARTVPAPPPAGPASLAPTDPASLPPTRWLTEPYDAPLHELPAAEEPTPAERPLRAGPPRCAARWRSACSSATAVAAWPYLATVTVLVVTWLLCAGDAHGQRPPRPHAASAARAGTTCWSRPSRRRGTSSRPRPARSCSASGRSASVLAGILLCYAFGLAHCHHAVRRRAVPGGGVWLGPGPSRCAGRCCLVARPLARRTTAVAGRPAPAARRGRDHRAPGGRSHRLVAPRAHSRC